MKKIIVILFLLLFLLPYVVDARQGCCSHHGGVCGCRCCDGTSLSATCAPYYPSCSPPKPSYTPPVNNPPVIQKTLPVNNTNNLIPSDNSKIPITKTNESKNEFDFGDFISEWWWVLGLGGWILWSLIKNKIDKRKK